MTRTLLRPCPLLPVKSRPKGFTIVELALVLVITAILATLAVYTYNKIVNKARFTQAKIALKHLQKVELVYFSDNGRYTDNLAQIGFDPVRYTYYDISVTLLDNAMSYIGYATGVRAMKNDLWSITPGGAPTQDNVAKTFF